MTARYLGLVDFWVFRPRGATTWGGHGTAACTNFAAVSISASSVASTLCPRGAVAVAVPPHGMWLLTTATVSEVVDPRTAHFDREAKNRQ